MDRATKNTPTQLSKKAKSKNGISKTTTKNDVSQVPTNAKGGIQISEQEIEEAFRFFDGDGSGKLTIDDLTSRLSLLSENITAKEVQVMLNGKEGLTLTDVKDIMKENEMKTVDPWVEVFEALDPDGNGYVDTECVRQKFLDLGFGMKDEEIDILVSCADCDKDGKISLDDFRKMLT